MPFSLIPAALGVAFFLVWAFIGGMLLRDGRLAAQQDRDLENPILPMASSRHRGAA